MYKVLPSHIERKTLIAGWSSPVARQAHNLKVGGSNPSPATNIFKVFEEIQRSLFFTLWDNYGTFSKTNAKRWQSIKTGFYLTI